MLVRMLLRTHIVIEDDKDLDNIYTYFDNHFPHSQPEELRN